MENLEQLQLVVGEVQAARQQVSSVRAQVQELEGTITAVQNQPDHLALHRQLGGVLVEVADREALISELQQTLSALNVTWNGSLSVNFNWFKPMMNSRNHFKGLKNEFN